MRSSCAFPHDNKDARLRDDDVYKSRRATLNFSSWLAQTASIYLIKIMHNRAHPLEHTPSVIAAQFCKRCAAVFRHWIT